MSFKRVRSPFLSLILWLHILDFHFGRPFQSVCPGAKSGEKNMSTSVVQNLTIFYNNFSVVFGVNEDAESIFNTYNVIVKL